jgi:hypothetical protein
LIDERVKRAGAEGRQLTGEGGLFGRDENGVGEVG